MCQPLQIHLHHLSHHLLQSPEQERERERKKRVYLKASFQYMKRVYSYLLTFTMEAIGYLTQQLHTIHNRYSGVTIRGSPRGIPTFFNLSSPNTCSWPTTLMYTKAPLIGIHLILLIPSLIVHNTVPTLCCR